MKTRRVAVLLVVLGALTGAAAVQYWPTPRRAALARVAALDGVYAEQTDPEGGAYRVCTVMLTLRPVTEEDLAVLRDIRPLHRLLLDGSPVTDAGLAHLEDLEELELLNLTDSQVTDAGLAHLAGLRNLRILSLRRTRVTDAGLIHLRGLTELRSLNLLETAVTEDGIAELRRALPQLGRIDLHAADDD